LAGARIDTLKSSAEYSIFSVASNSHPESTRTTSFSSLIYLHGLGEGGPQDLKAEHCRTWAEAHNVSFVAPDLNQPSFESLTISAQVKAIELLLNTLAAPAVLVGTSLGGLVAVAATRRITGDLRHRVKNLILLAPAFGFARRRLSVDQSPSRQNSNTIIWSSALGRWVRLGPQLLEDLPAWVEADTWTLDIPMYLLHGLRDEVVPKSESEAFVARNPDARLLIIDDDHNLSTVAAMDALDQILAEISLRAPTK
jgi:pimeloyl-ACP methyl ester carboxylesterase